MKNTISLIIPNISIALLERFFQNNTFLRSVPLEVIVVTNRENAREADALISKNLDIIKFIFLPQNLGFASTVNAGFRVAKGKWLATANDDTILSSDLWEKLLACTDEKTGSINPVIYKPDGSIESAGIKILDKGKAQPLTEIQNKTHCYETDATNAAVVVYNREALEKVGLYDERFGSYLEDIDLSLRLTRAGYKNIVVPTAKATHIGQSTSKRMGRKKRYYDFRNWILVILKNWGAKKLILDLPSILVERLRNFWGIFK